jgi:hypothetical protein
MPAIQHADRFTSKLRVNAWRLLLLMVLMVLLLLLLLLVELSRGVGSRK